MKRMLCLMTIGLLLSSLGCSNQWREIDGEMSAEDMDSMFASVSATALESSAMMQIKAMKDDPATVVYFATAPGPLGPVVSIASLYSFAFMGSDGANLNYWDIAKVQVFLFDRLTEAGHEAGFLIGYNTDNSETYITHAFVGTASFNGGKYRAVFTNGSQNVLAVESHDVIDGDLANVIQLKAFDFDGAGNEHENGQFSTLVGFGG